MRRMHDWKLCCKFCNTDGPNHNCRVYCIKCWQLPNNAGELKHVTRLTDFVRTVHSYHPHPSRYAKSPVLIIFQIPIRACWHTEWSFCCTTMTLLTIEWSLLQRTCRSDGCSEDFQCFWIAWTTPENCPFPLGNMHRYLIHSSLGPQASSSKMACRSVQSFLHSSP